MGSDSPHPLAAALIERLRSQPAARVLEVGQGRGRNTAALLASNFSVQSIRDGAEVPDVESAFDAALSTHALLHGTPSTVEAGVRAIARALKPDAPLYATFASKRDGRFGQGTRVAEDAFTPNDGEERDVPHAYFDESGLRRILEERFVIESLDERSVDEVVGAWAHPQRPHGSVHWFVRARRRSGA